MYSSSSSRHGSSTKISLPQSMPAGAIIGRGGQNIQMLQRRSGARMNVSRSGQEVVISGSPAAVQAAARLLNMQIKVFLASGGGYPHPLQVHYLLSPLFGDDARARVNFAVRQDEVAQAAGRHEQLYDLQPAVTAGSAASPAGAPVGSVESLSQALSAMGLSSSIGIPFHLAGQQDGVVAQLVAAAGKSMQHRPAFDDLKIRFNFGKALWYFPRTAAPSNWTIQEMQAKEIPTDLKSVFSNGVQAGHVSRLQDWLASRGFAAVESKERASVHLLHHEANASYGLSFIKETGGGLTLRKAKTGNNKLFFLTLLCSSGQPDWRAKLLAQYHLKQGSEVQALLSDIAASATLDPSSFTRLHFPGLSAHDMSVDKERHKSKTIYLGSFSGSASTTGSSSSSSATQIKLTVSKLLSAKGRADGFEVAGTSPQVNELLMAMLRGCTAAGRELAAHIHNILAFAHAATTALSVA